MEDLLGLDQVKGWVNSSSTQQSGTGIMSPGRARGRSITPEPRAGPHGVFSPPAGMKINKPAQNSQSGTKQSSDVQHSIKGHELDAIFGVSQPAAASDVSAAASKKKQHSGISVEDLMSGAGLNLDSMSTGAQNTLSPDQSVPSRRNRNIENHVYSSMTRSASAQPPSTRSYDVLESLWSSAKPTPKPGNTNTAAPAKPPTMPSMPTSSAMPIINIDTVGSSATRSDVPLRQRPTQNAAGSTGLGHRRHSAEDLQMSAESDMNMNGGNQGDLIDFGFSNHTQTTTTINTNANNANMGNSRGYSSAPSNPISISIKPPPAPAPAPSGAGTGSRRRHDDNGNADDDDHDVFDEWLSMNDSEQGSVVGNNNNNSEGNGVSDTGSVGSAAVEDLEKLLLHDGGGDAEVKPKSKTKSQGKSRTKKDKRSKGKEKEKQVKVKVMLKPVMKPSRPTSAPPGPRSHTAPAMNMNMNDPEMKAILKEMQMEEEERKKEREARQKEIGFDSQPHSGRSSANVTLNVNGNASVPAPTPTPVVNQIASAVREEDIHDDSAGLSQERRELAAARIAERDERAERAKREFRETEDAKKAEREAEEVVEEDVKDLVREWSKWPHTAPLQSLVATLQQILPSSYRWTSISLGALLTDDGIKKGYRKAVMTVHPDKVAQRGGDIRERLLAKYVFDTLNQAHSKYQDSRPQY